MFFNDSFFGSIAFVLSFILSLFKFEVVFVSLLLFSVTCVFCRVLSHCSGIDDLMKYKNAHLFVYLQVYLSCNHY